jgi:predicted DNA-binding protein (MmcQ/YjbR family)
MATSSQFRALALALPGVEEKSHFGKADFRVQNKIFAGLAPGRHPAAGAEQPERGYFKAGPELREELSGSASALNGAFALAEGAWGRSGWTYVELPKVELALLSELLMQSWKLVAPAKLAAARAPDSSPKRSHRRRTAAESAPSAPLVKKREGVLKRGRQAAAGTVRARKGRVR